MQFAVALGHLNHELACAADTASVEKNLAGFVQLGVLMKLLFLT